MTLVIPQTKSQQVVHFLEEQIRSGRLRCGDRLQTVRELAAMFKVSSFVINTAYNELEKRNLIERRGRRGVFVCDPARKDERFLVVNYPGTHTPESMVPQMMRTFERTCFNAHIELDWLHRDFLRGGDRDHVLATLRERQYRGAVLLDSFYLGNEPELDILRELAIPVILPHGGHEDVQTTGFIVMGIDHAAAWRDALGHLYEQGFRRLGALTQIAPVGGRLMRSGSLEAHYAMMEEQGFDRLSDCVRCLRYEDKAAFEAGLEQWLGRRPRFDAIICYSDFFALRLYQYCREKGIRIPHDLAVMGYCGHAGCEQLSPPLSTIDMKMAEGGQKAAEILIQASQRTRHASQSRLVVASHRLASRQSTSRVQASGKHVSVTPLMEEVSC